MKRRSFITAVGLFPLFPEVADPLKPKPPMPTLGATKEPPESFMTFGEELRKKATELEGYVDIDNDYEDRFFGWSVFRESDREALYTVRLSKDEVRRKVEAIADPMRKELVKRAFINKEGQIALARSMTPSHLWPTL